MFLFVKNSLGLLCLLATAGDATGRDPVSLLVRKRSERYRDER